MSYHGDNKPRWRWHIGILLFGSVLCCIAFPVAALADLQLQPLTVQLKWRHQFQFAGYYMALERGYYRAAGFKVLLKEAEPTTDVVAEVMSGRADFGVGSSELVLARQIHPVVALAPIYQHSPFVLLARADRASNLHELVRQPLMLEAGSAEILALFQQEGIEPARLDIRPYHDGIQPLLANDVAAMSAYSTTEPYLLRQAGLQHNEFSARAGGIDFYGDILFTSAAQVDNSPIRVEAFIKATLAGWQYAMSHIEETIDVIMARYNTQQHSRDHYRFEAAESRRLMQPDLVSIGHVNPGRWRHIADTYASLGMLPPDFSLDGFIYQPQTERINTRIIIALILTVLVAVALALLTVYVYRLNRRLQNEICQRERTHQQLVESEALHRLLTENSGDVIWMLDLVSQQFDYVSPSIQRLCGCTPDYLLAQPVTAVFTASSATHLMALIQTHRERLQQGDMSARYMTLEVNQVHHHGHTIPVEITVTYLINAAGQANKLLGITRDISARRTVEAQLRRRLAAIEAAGDGIAITDISGCVFYVNPTFTQQTGYDFNEIEGQSLRVLKSGQHDGAFYAQLWQTILSGQTWRGELINRRKHGELYEEEMTISPVLNSHGDIECFVAIKRDISEKRALEQALLAANERLATELTTVRHLQATLAEQAIRDPLTGLYNRRYLDETLARELARAAHEDYPLVLGFVDVDHFKHINDTWGHPIGDEVLKHVAQLLQTGVREGDLVCRYGGEEFVLVLPHLSLDAGLKRAEQLRARFAAEPLNYAPSPIHATLCIGLAVFPTHGRTAVPLIAQADAALYSAKHAGRNRVAHAPLPIM